MRAIVILLLSAACLGISLADEDKKTRIMNFYKCMCEQDQTAKDEVMKCAELKPEKCKEIADECKAEVMPEATTVEQRWDTYCKNEHDEAERLYECIMNHDKKKELNDDEKTQLKEYITCVKKIDKKYCHH